MGIKKHKLGGIELPLFVVISNTYLRLIKRESGYYYYRDGGNWDCDIEVRDGKLCADLEGASLIDGKEIIKTTKAKWKKDNGHYVSDLSNERINNCKE